jgi:hypothetical protein
MAYNPELAKRVRQWFHRHRVIAEGKRMMSGLCVMVHSKICLGVECDRLVVSLAMPDLIADFFGHSPDSLADRRAGD